MKWWWREDLDHMVLVVYMIRLVKGWFVVELLLMVLLVMVSMRDNLLIVGWLIPSHPIFGGLGFRAIPGGVCAIFAMKEAVEPSWLWSSASASSSGVGVVALLCGILLATRCVSGGVLVGYGVDLLLVAVWPAGFGLRWPDPCFAGLRSVLGFQLRLYLALM
jgi:hypothetical protein